MQHLRFFMEFCAYAVATELAYHAVAQRLDETLNCMADIYQLGTGLDHPDAAPQ